jgi:hypothetical protein
MNVLQLSVSTWWDEALLHPSYVECVSLLVQDYSE